MVIKRISDWFYDKLINMYVEELAKEQDDAKKAMAVVSRYKQAAAKLERSYRDKTVSEEKYHQLSRSLNINNPHCDNVERAFMEIPKDEQESIQRLRSAKPFLIGKVTLDSLINQRPESYEYILDGKLPFDNMFFEFQEPIDIPLPSNMDIIHPQGMHVIKHVLGTVAETEDEKRLFYRIRLCTRTDIVEGISIIFSPALPDYLIAFVRKDLFTVDLHNNICVHDCHKNPLNLEIGQELMGYILRGQANALHDWYKNIPDGFEGVSLMSMPGHDYFFTAANLCTNLVNYINAHNVTIRNCERDVTVIERNERGKAKKKVVKEPFYLITVKDVEIKESGHTDKSSWTLTERIYVRGHDRRLRDDEGHIRMVTWVSPCIKGPEGAPFANQRYEVLAKKLLEERAMIGRYTETPHKSYK